MEIKQLARINMVITIAVFVGNVFYQGLGFFYPLKIVCSSGFAIMGIINMLYAYKKMEDKKLLFFMMFGLVFAFLGDVAINPNFILGVIFFALGHVFFVVSYWMYRKMNMLDFMLCIGLGVFSIGFILFFPYIVFDIPILRYVVLVYAGIISVMVGKSVGNVLCRRNIFTGMIAIGSILFFISDMMLLLAWFSSIEGRWTSHVCMATYYPALCMLAYSMVMYVKNSRDILVGRVMQMDSYFQEIQAIIGKDRKMIVQDEVIREKIQLLKQYQESGQWLKDFECDERGELPFALNRGLLSEDGLYNLLNEVDEMLSTR